MIPSWPNTQAWNFLKEWVVTPDESAPIILNNTPSENLEAALLELKMVAACSDNQVEVCRACQSCHLVSIGQHPDIIDFRPETATITIKTIRGILQDISTTPMQKRRLVVLRSIELLSMPAATALLKSLEEPSATTKFLLISAYPRQILPTIRSRCQYLRLPNRQVNLPDRQTNLPTKQTDSSLAVTTPGTTNEEDQEIKVIASKLSRHLHDRGPSPELRRAYWRLRDYYMIKSRRGNKKLAKEILQLSLPSVI